MPITLLPIQHRCTAPSGCTSWTSVSSNVPSAFNFIRHKARCWWSFNEGYSSICYVDACRLTYLQSRNVYTEMLEDSTWEPERSMQERDEVSISHWVIFFGVLHRPGFNRRKDYCTRFTMLYIQWKFENIAVLPYVNESKVTYTITRLYKFVATFVPIFPEIDQNLGALPYETLSLQNFEEGVLSKNFSLNFL